MNAEEWLERYDNFTFYPEYDAYFVTKMHEAADIIRAQAEEIERLERAVERAIERLELRCVLSGSHPHCGEENGCATHWREYLMGEGARRQGL